MNNIYSMTGFGKGEAENESIKFNVEIKTVNNKYCDISVKIPRYVRTFEERVRKEIAKQLKRGRVDVGITYEILRDCDTEIKPNNELALRYKEAFSSLAENLQVEKLNSIEPYLKIPDMITIIKKEENEESLWDVLNQALNNAVAEVVDMRIKEGNELSDDIMGNLEIINQRIKSIEKESESIVSEYREKLINRINNSFSEDYILDENKLYNEIVFYADKADINEEIVRLKSHLAQIKDTIEEGGVIGRKIDFILQEVNREANTIASKSNKVNMTQDVIEIKNHLEKMREQALNIE